MPTPHDRQSPGVNHFMMMTSRDKIRQDWNWQEDKASSEN